MLMIYVQTCILESYVKMLSGLEHWDDPEGWDEEGSGRGVQDGEHM